MYKIIAKASLIGERFFTKSSTKINMLLPKGDILDSNLIANECVEDYKRRKQKGVVLKLDLEKA